MDRQNTEESTANRTSPAKIALATLIAGALALPLGGCFGIPDVDEIVGSKPRIIVINKAEELADSLSSVEWGKVSRLVVKDATSGEVVREVTDQAEIERAFAALSEENGLATKPGEPAEYTFELWQPETQKAGQSAADLDEIKVLEVTTYEGSTVVTLEMSTIGLKLHISSQDTADSLRALAG